RRAARPEGNGLLPPPPGARPARGRAHRHGTRGRRDGGGRRGQRSGIRDRRAVAPGRGPRGHPAVRGARRRGAPVRGATARGATAGGPRKGGRVMSVTAYDVISPVDETIVETVPSASRGDIDEAVERAHRAFESWRKVAPGDRARLLRRFAETVDGDI